MSMDGPGKISRRDLLAGVVALGADAVISASNAHAKDSLESSATNKEAFLVIKTVLIDRDIARTKSGLDSTQMDALVESLTEYINGLLRHPTPEFTSALVTLSQMSVLKRDVLPIFRTKYKASDEIAALSVTDSVLVALQLIATEAKRRIPKMSSQ